VGDTGHGIQLALVHCIGGLGAGGNMGDLAFTARAADGHRVVTVGLRARTKGDTVDTVGGRAGTQGGAVSRIGPCIPADRGGVVIGRPGTGTEGRRTGTAGTRRDQAEEGAAADGDTLCATGFAGLADGDGAAACCRRSEADSRGVGTGRRRAVAQCGAEAAAGFAVATDGGGAIGRSGTAETAGQRLRTAGDGFRTVGGAVDAAGLCSGAGSGGADATGYRAVAECGTVFTGGLRVAAYRGRIAARGQRVDAHGGRVGGHGRGTTAERGGAIADRIGRFTGSQCVVAFHIGPGITVGAAAGLEVLAGVVRRCGDSIELVLVD